MDFRVSTILWMFAALVALTTFPASHATLQMPLGLVETPLGTETGGEVMPESLSEENNPNPQSAGGHESEEHILNNPNPQVGGDQEHNEHILNNPNPQVGGDQEHNEHILDQPVAGISNVEETDTGIHGAPQFVHVTDMPQIDHQTLSIRPLKPTTPTSLLAPTPTRNMSELGNNTDGTSADVNNTTMGRSNNSEEVSPRPTFPETTNNILHSSQSEYVSSAYLSSHLVPTRVTVDQSSTIGANLPDILIPQPDSNLKLTSRPIIDETETISPAPSHGPTLPSSEHVIVGSRVIPDITVLETMSSNITLTPVTAGVHPSHDVSLISSTSVSDETGTKDIKQNKPPDTATYPYTDGVRSVIDEQTLSIQDISPSSSISSGESSSGSLTTSSMLTNSTEETTTSTSTSSTPGTPAEPVVITLPSVSHEIVIQKNSTLSVVTTTAATPAATTATNVHNIETQSTTTVARVSQSTSSKRPTTKLSTSSPPTTLLVSLLRSGSTSRGTTSWSSSAAPHTTSSTTVPVTTIRISSTTKHKDKPHRGDSDTNTTTSNNSTEMPESTTADGSSRFSRKKTQGPHASRTTLPSPTSSVNSTSASSSSSSRLLTTVNINSTSYHSVSPSTQPPVFALVTLKMSWQDFCPKERVFRADLKDIFLEKADQDVTTEQITLMNIEHYECLDLMAAEMPDDIIISFYLVDITGNYDRRLTIACARVVIQGFSTKVESFFKDKLVEVKLNTDQPSEGGHVTHMPEEKGRESLFVMEPGITIAIVIASVGGACCVALIILQIVVRNRNKRVYLPDSRHPSFTSMDSIALASVTKSRPNSGLFNPGLDPSEMAEPSFPVNFAGLANRCLEPEVLQEEFQFVPNLTPRLSTVPVGAEDKNRYANVIPIPETRVKLKRRRSQAASDYINANFVTGYNDDKRAYVATQAPLDSTVADFWRMVWEQQSRVIIMLTAMEENGHPKCAHYLPDCLGDSLQRYGDFMILLKKKDVHQEYIISILELKDIENNLVREVKHCWYTAWPQHGGPEPISLVKFILDTRVFYEDSGAPLIVHCSPGTGRTGTFIGTDLCMRQYENRRIVDILHTVFRLRKERAGSVQTKEQYTLIYNALNEYASVLSSPAISTASSSMTLHSVP
ncbi:uncharacterized protein LOC124113387 [Haliotis rufescens]|uniref:uncharacterized protein LOC124113387 n=1 Tax=Haliotis rufescens TaxID=6454 RepID=UPI00201EEED3|nr:uncharacterized protein LOC124113387 [Haliotis rufescens]XP_046329649.2 uncharacterized protein LOC124113387 [Haliotis rufescens]